MRSGKVIVIGSSNVDMVVRLDRIPSPGETLLGGHFAMNAGGKGANQAVAAKRAGGDVVFVSAVGRDSFGDFLTGVLKKENIPTSTLVRSGSHSTGVALISVDKSGRNSISVAPGANFSISATILKKTLAPFKSCSVMLLQLEIPVDAVTYAAKLGFQNNMKVILNPAPAAKLPKKLLYHVDYLTPNEHEAEQLSGVKINGIESAQKAAVKILKSGVKNVIITLGAKGVYCVGSFGSFYQPAFKVKAKDTTAAGDTFNGAFAVAIGKGLSLTEAIKFGCAASAIAVTREGALTSVPDAIEIEKFLHASLDQKKLGTHISK